FHIVKDRELNINLEDEITSGTLITYRGKVVHKTTLESMSMGTGGRG
ncbi:MAG: hypothetical protein J3T61_01180, partial [Candidatus Brocadiales bacterium]|nr:hypothetical protein [Candidatus Bathyanammoxibius sp.]